MNDQLFSSPYGVEGQALQRKQMLVDMLMKQALSPQQGQMVSGHYIAPGLGGALSQLAAFAGANKAQSGIDEQRQGLAGKYRSGLAEGLQKFLRTTEGGSDVLSDQQASDLLNNDIAPTPAPANPKGAAAEALTSQYPELQNLGKAQLSALLGREKALEKFGHSPTLMSDPATGRLVNALIGDQGTVRPIQGFAPVEKYEATGGGQLYKPYTAERGPYLGEEYGPTAMVNGEAVRFNQHGKPVQVANRPPQTTLAVNNQPETAYGKARGEGKAQLAAQVEKSGMAATGILQSISQLRALDAAGTLSGPAAIPGVFLGQLGQSLGLPAKDASVANSEAYRSQVRELLIAKMNELGGAKGLSEKETLLVSQAFPDLERSPAARKVIFDMMERKAGAAQQAYQALLAEERKAFPGQPMMQFDFSTAAGAQAPGVPQPPGPAAAAQSPAQLPATDKQGWVLHIDSAGRKAYVSPDGKQYQEVR